MKILKQNLMMLRCDGAKFELQEVVEFLKEPEKFGSRCKIKRSFIRGPPEQ